MSALVKLHIVLKPLMLRRVKSSKDENGEPLVKLPPKARRARAPESDARLARRRWRRRFT